MGFGLTILAVVWAIGWVMGVAPRKRLLALALIWAGFVLAVTLLPEAHGLRLRLGGAVKPWLVWGGVGALVVAYAAAVRALRPPPEPAPTPQTPTPQDPATFSPAEIERYSRHILMHEIGGPGQKALKAAHLLVIGAGGLGAPALMYLAASGVGRITVMDGDRVEASNLQRQIIHATDRIGQNKAQSAARTLAALNPHVTVTAIPERITPENAAERVAEADLVLDGSDNFDTRYLVNAACVAAGKPLIATALTQWEGQISLWHPSTGGPCYECVFPTRPSPGMVAPCAEAGVAGPLPGILGAMMALEAVKHLTGAGQTLAGRLLLVDGLTMETRMIRVKPRAGCACCGVRQATG